MSVNKITSFFESQGPAAPNAGGNQAPHRATRECSHDPQGKHGEKGQEGTKVIGGRRHRETLLFDSLSHKSLIQQGTNREVGGMLLHFIRAFPKD